MTAPRVPVTTSNASLIGGIVVSIATVVLWITAMAELGFHGKLVVGTGVLVAIAAGAWTRAADL